MFERPQNSDGAKEAIYTAKEVARLLLDAVQDGRYFSVEMSAETESCGDGPYPKKRLTGSVDIHILIRRTGGNPVEKKPMPTVFAEDPATPEGKYLVKRRDGTVPEWPNFVLGAADPIAEVALRAYAAEVDRIIYTEPELARTLGLTKEFVSSLYRRAEVFRQWREKHPVGDPGMGRHRQDDPATIAEMRKGQGA